MELKFRKNNKMCFVCEYMICPAFREGKINNSGLIIYGRYLNKYKISFRKRYLQDIQTIYSNVPGLLRYVHKLKLLNLLT